MALYRRLDGYDELKPLIDTSDEQVLARLGAPTLVRIPGTAASPRARLVSCLLHGNEDSGYRAVLGLLRSGARFPFDLWVFFGNVAAASTSGWFGHRYLEGQEDFNRIWGASSEHTGQRQTAEAVLEVLADQPLEAALDLHNTTGDNPAHAVVPGDAPGSEALAAVCCDLVLRWRLSAHTLMEAVAQWCPAVAVECGLPGRPAGVEVAAGVLHRFLSADDLPGDRAPERTFELRERVVVPPEVAFVFGGPLTGDLDLVVSPGLDRHNFGMLLAGSRIGQVRPGAPVPLRSYDMVGRDVTSESFAVTEHGALVVRHDVTPVMMTRNVTQTRRDCLFYIARRR